MRLDLKTLARKVGNIEVTEEMREMVNWLNSACGRAAVICAVEKSQSELKELNKARRVEQDQLNIPITL